MFDPRDPRAGRPGVVEDGALADLILVDGNRLQNLDLLADPDRNFVVMLKDGVFYKNTVKQSRGRATRNAIGRDRP